MKATIHKNLFLYLSVVCVLAIMAYHKLFYASFISWDDADVLLNNKDVHDFNVNAFFTKYYVGNYAPVTMLGFAVDWLIFKGSAIGHHTVNFVLHLANCLLVYYLSALLFKDKLKSVLCTIIFCLHPLQVETIAWVSAKNNLMYAQFFLLGLIFYSKYLLQNLKKYYVLALMFFIISVLCKPSAICFPLCLVLLDYFLKQKNTLKSYTLNKLPFIFIALVFGLATIYTRTEDNFINQNHSYAFYERIGYGGYAILQYLYKFFIPVNLSVLYPYPENTLLSISLGYGIIALLLFACYKLYKKGNKNLVIGILFFIINLLLVLQFLPFGEVLTADRYMYLPIIGLCWGIVSVISLKEKQFILIAIVLSFILGTVTFLRTAIWKNSTTLYSDVVKKYPHFFLALNSLGAEYMLTKNYDQSLIYLNKAINENTNYYKGYYNRGLLYAQTNQMQAALNDFNKVISLKPYNKAYIARANAYYNLHDFNHAIADAEIVLKTEPLNVKANYVLATSYDDNNELSKALNYYNTTLYLDNTNPLIFLRRGILFGKKGEFNSCLNDLNSCIALDTNFAEAYYWRGVAKVNLKQNPCSDLNKSVSLGFDLAKPTLKNYCK